MNILISTDDRYVMPYSVMLTSLLSTNPCSENAYHTIYMLESRLSDSLSNRLEELIRSYGAVYKRIKVPTEVFAWAKAPSYFTKETYYPLIAPQYLPKELERILLLDADIIVRGNIQEFYETPLKNHAAAVCGYGPLMEKMIRKQAEELGMKSSGSYFNSGVVLLNLKECRSIILPETSFQMVEAHSKAVKFPDQDILNLLLEGRTIMKDYREYNCMIHSISGNEDLQYAREHARIVHFPGEAKPWKFYDIHFAEEWMNWYRKCFGENADLKRMSYYRLKALFDRKNTEQK